MNDPSARFELLTDVRPGLIRVAVFDFDGTLSLLRTGWQTVMIDLMVETLQAAGAGETEAALRIRLRELVDQSTGRQTIDQMQMLVELVRQGGAPPAAAAQYKELYLKRLGDHMQLRLNAIASGVPTDQFLVAGARGFLSWLSNRGVTMCLVSGTDEQAVIEEVHLLGIAQYFADRVFGGLNETGAFTKLDAMRRVLAGQGAAPEATVTFGDGVMDVCSARELGALAVGVASDEERGCGWDEHKRRLLAQAGAQVLIGDYLGFEQWIDKLIQGSGVRGQGSGRDHAR